MEEILTLTSICEKGILLRSSVENRSVLNCNSPSVEVLFHLLRIALGKEEPSSLPNDVNWQEVYELSLKQGVGAIACDGMLALKECSIDEELRYKWMGQSMVIEQKYYQHKKAIAELADFYHRHNIQMMLLKGYGLSLNYPIPEHRPSGDIDIFLLKKTEYDKGTFSLLCGNEIAKDADLLVYKELGIDVSKSEDEHHSHFQFNNIVVENHYEIGNTYSRRKEEVVLESQLELLVKEKYVVGDNANLYFPSVDFNAVFLMKHLYSHCIGEKNSIRQLLDWALFLDRYNEYIDWNRVMEIWRITGLKPFANIINHLVIRLQFIGEAIIPEIECMPTYENYILEDVINGISRGNSTLSNLLYYYKQRKKYTMLSHRGWLSRTFDSFYLHLFKHRDMRKKSIK